MQPTKLSDGVHQEAKAIAAFGPVSFKLAASCSWRCWIRIGPVSKHALFKLRTSSFLPSFLFNPWLGQQPVFRFYSIRLPPSPPTICTPQPTYLHSTSRASRYPTSYSDTTPARYMCAYMCARARVLARASQSTVRPSVRVTVLSARR